MVSSINGKVVQMANSTELGHLISNMVDTIIDAGWMDFAFVGVVRGGDTLAHLMGAELSRRGLSVPDVYSIDITLYRDDLYSGLERPILTHTNLPLSVDGLRLVLVDDVLFTGRTIRAALQEISDYGRPEWVRLAVLVDRGHRELLIQADIVGQQMTASKVSKVEVSIHHPLQAEEVFALMRGNMTNLVCLPKDVLGLRGMSSEQLTLVLDTARISNDFKTCCEKGSNPRGRTVVMAFFENSTRTKISFEVAARFSADVISFSASTSSSKAGKHCSILQEWMRCYPMQW